MSIVIEQARRPSLFVDQLWSKTRRLIRSGDLAAAERLYRAATESVPSAAAKVAFGQFLTDVCRDAEALAVLEAASVEARSDGDAETVARSLNLQARIYHRVGRGVDAQRCEQRAIRFELESSGSLSASTLVNLAATAAAAGDARRADDLLRSARRVAQGGESVHVRLAQGGLQAERGRPVAAARLFRRAVRLARSNCAMREEAEARLRLAALLCREKRYRAAMRHGLKAERLYCLLGGRDLEARSRRLIDLAAAARESRLVEIALN